MGFYEERLYPILEKTADALLETEHMQNIINGTMPLERFQFQLRQNFNYLKDFSRCWAIGLARCNDYDEMSLWYASLKGVFEQELGESLRYWADASGASIESMENETMAEGKRSYTSHELARAWEGDNSMQIMAQFPCTILYLLFAEKACPKCTLPEDNMYHHWLFFYISDWYREHCERSIKLVNKLAENKSPEHLARMEEACAISCNYELLQFENLYNKEQTWPLPEIIPDKKRTIATWDVWNKDK